LPGQIAPLLALPDQIAPLLALPDQIAPLLALPDQIASLTAMVVNKKRRRSNRKPQVNFQPLAKENAGLLVLDGLVPAGVAAPVVLAVPPAIGTFPGGIFPINTAQILQLTHAQILELIYWYNDTMLIAPGDSAAVRQAKVLSWITGN